MNQEPRPTACGGIFTSFTSKSAYHVSPISTMIGIFCSSIKSVLTQMKVAEMEIAGLQDLQSLNRQLYRSM